MRSPLQSLRKTAGTDIRDPRESNGLISGDYRRLRGPAGSLLRAPRTLGNNIHYFLDLEKSPQIPAERPDVLCLLSLQRGDYQ
jgi:hypothetical protein